MAATYTQIKCLILIFSMLPMHVILGEQNTQCEGDCDCPESWLEECGKYLETCQCCAFCTPFHIRCTESDAGCYPVVCTGQYCWCYSPITGDRVGDLVSYKVVYSYLEICDDLWFFLNKTLQAEDNSIKQLKALAPRPRRLY